MYAGFPRDTNNWAPAWVLPGTFLVTARPFSAGGWHLLRHPCLRGVQLGYWRRFAAAAGDTCTDRRPVADRTVNAFQVFHGTVCGVQGSSAAICGAAVTPGSPVRHSTSLVSSGSTRLTSPGLARSCRSRFTWERTFNTRRLSRPTSAGSKW